MKKGLTFSEIAKQFYGIRIGSVCRASECLFSTLNGRLFESESALIAEDVDIWSAVMPRVEPAGFLYTDLYLQKTSDYPRLFMRSGQREPPNLRLLRRVEND